MKSTQPFKDTIQQYLELRTKTDELFAISYGKAGKNIDDCITYVLSSVKESGRNGFTDDEIYSIAVHYYDEDNIEVGKPVKCSVIVNHVIELTEEDKQKAYQDALKKAHDEAYADIMRKPSKPKITTTVQQISLFGDEAEN